MIFFDNITAQVQYLCKLLLFLATLVSHVP